MRTIRARLTFAYSALLVTTLVVLSIALYVAMGRALEGAALDSVKSLSDQTIGLAAAAEGDARGIAIDFSDATLSETLARGGLYLEVRAPNGSVLSRSSSLRGRSLVDSHQVKPELGPRAFEQTIPGIGQVLTYIAPMHTNKRYLGVVAAGRSMADTNEAMARLRSLLIAGDVFALVIAVLGGWWLAGAALQPVDRITRAARSISAGALSQRLHLIGADDELHRLAAAFDDMLERLEGAFDRERQFTADAAHELRTPLTILRGEIEVAMRKPREGDDYRRTLGNLGDEVGRLSRLVDNLLLLARMDAGKAPLRTEVVRLRTFVSRIAERNTTRAADKGVALTFAGESELAVKADPDRLTQALDNLIDNAIRHTRSGGRVEMSWLAERDGTLIEVADTGDGIASEHLPHVFQRFYRLDTHRSRNGGGAGLGLAITKQIIEAHGGTIAAATRPGYGAVFTIHIPSP
ncbi:MAG: heavy metal sensor histidine kinase [Candidatus Eremiobacteraeota bacterium]|nr:heavy metal sensor histidine kinase [Candidatus Eremiobacteraeota bacterium]